MSGADLTRRALLAAEAAALLASSKQSVALIG